MGREGGYVVEFMLATVRGFVGLVVPSKALWGQGVWGGKNREPFIREQVRWVPMPEFDKGPVRPFGE